MPETLLPNVDDISYFQSRDKNNLCIILLVEKLKIFLHPTILSRITINNSKATPLQPHKQRELLLL